MNLPSQLPHTTLTGRSLQTSQRRVRLEPAAHRHGAPPRSEPNGGARASSRRQRPLASRHASEPPPQAAVLDAHEPGRAGGGRQQLTQRKVRMRLPRTLEPRPRNGAIPRWHRAAGHVGSPARPPYPSTGRRSPRRRVPRPLLPSRHPITARSRSSPTTETSKRPRQHQGLSASATARFPHLAEDSLLRVASATRAQAPRSHSRRRSAPDDDACEPTLKSRHPSQPGYRRRRPPAWRVLCTGPHLGSCRARVAIRPSPVPEHLAGGQHERSGPNQRQKRPLCAIRMHCRHGGVPFGQSAALVRLCVSLGAQWRA